MSRALDTEDGVLAPAQSAARSAVAKVPEITAIFWVVKILTTAMGESTSDFLNQELGPAIAVPIMLIVLGVALRLQLKASRYVAWTYWLVVVAVAVFGTSAADALHVVLGIPYLISTSFYLVVLAVILTAWYRSEKTLSIHSIHTRRRESFYWATVLATFALGTAAGDMTATTMHLGFLASGLMFTGWILVPAVAYLRFGVNEVLTFWFAYILTRPLGASFADWMAVAHHSGGLGFGTGAVAVTLSILIVAFVGYLSIARSDVEGEVGIEGERSVRLSQTLDSRSILGAEVE
jgi:uncharacterized membrane-anchored protein